MSSVTINMAEKQMITKKNFIGTPFKLILPKVFYSGGHLHVQTSLQYQSGHKEKLLLERCQVKDKLKNSYILSEQVLLDEFNNRGKLMAKKVVPENRILLNGAVLVVSIICENGNLYNVFYNISRTMVSLDHVAIEEAESKDIERLKCYKTSNVIKNNKQKAGDSIPFEKDNQPKEATQSATEKAFYDTPELISPVIKHNMTTTDNSLNSVSAIEDYKQAIIREMLYLKNEGGRRYIVNNGTLIEENKGVYAYSFELEAELHLADDAPIRITVGLTGATGIVLICEDFQIIILIDKDLGKTVPVAYITAEPWKLLDALHQKLAALSRTNEIAMLLLNQGPKLASKGTNTTIAKGQSLAIKKALSEKITVIWGPPGTGKTYTMSKIAIQAMKRGKTVLIVSHSNISVDGVVKAIASQAKEEKIEEDLHSGKILRYGYVRDEGLSSIPDAVSFEYTVRERKDLQKERDQLNQQKDILKSQHQTKSAKYVEVQRKLKSIHAQIRDEEKRNVNKARIVATTISKVTIDKIFEDRHFNLVMFDEVSMAYVPQLIIAAGYATEHFACVGDFRQLAPITQSGRANELKGDIFAFLGINNGESSIHSHPWLVMLDEQRRMHPDISAFPSQYIYNRLLKDYPGMKALRESIAESRPFSGSAMNLIDLSGTYSAASSNNDHSHYNILSALIAFSTAFEAEKNNPGNSVGIITPYIAQVRLIRAMISDQQQRHDTNISCATIHQFQGSERDIVVFDAIESFPHARVGLLMSDNTNGAVTRLNNVAITRAKGKLIVIANSRFWHLKMDQVQNTFNKLVQYIEEKGSVIGVKEKRLQTYLDEVPSSSCIRLYQDKLNAYKRLMSDIRTARNRIIISIPDGHLDQESQDAAYKMVCEARARGAQILCKCKDYASLPEQWKSISYASDNAIFPLLLIDDNIIWYGMPVADGVFKDKNRSLGTVFHTMYRITGEHTIEMIRSLTELENREVNGERTSFTQKNSAGTAPQSSSGTEKSGLSRYVERYSRCPECNKPMKLMRSGKSGKYYLRCSECTGTSFIAYGFVNDYIQREGVTCPQHHCNIRAGVGSRGLYIRCEEGHFLRPDEI